MKKSIILMLALFVFLAGCNDEEGCGLDLDDFEDEYEEFQEDIEKNCALGEDCDDCEEEIEAFVDYLKENVDCIKDEDDQEDIEDKIDDLEDALDDLDEACDGGEITESDLDLGSGGFNGGGSSEDCDEEEIYDDIDNLDIKIDAACYDDFDCSDCQKAIDNQRDYAESIEDCIGNSIQQEEYDGLMEYLDELEDALDDFC